LSAHIAFPCYQLHHDRNQTSPRCGWRDSPGDGGSPEEAPGAYKDIDTVMKSQGTLVTVEGKFYPRVVRMAKD